MQEFNVTELQSTSMVINLKSFYGLIQNDNKKIQCVYQELDNKNSIKVDLYLKYEFNIFIFA